MPITGHEFSRIEEDLRNVAVAFSAGNVDLAYLAIRLEELMCWVRVELTNCRVKAAGSQIRARTNGETIEEWAARSLLTPDENRALNPIPFLPGAPLTPEAIERGALARERQSAAIAFRCSIWNQLVLTWPEDKAIGGLYEAVLAVPLPAELLACGAAVSHMRTQNTVCVARSWTGRRCVLRHDDNLHRSKDGLRWRGNADEFTLASRVVLPPKVKDAFLTYFEKEELWLLGQLGDSDLYVVNDSWMVLIGVLADECGVTLRWNSLFAFYWAGDWPMDMAQFFATFPSLRSADLRVRENMTAGRPWGCAEAEPWEF